jgi:hypothetical protein
LLVALLIVSCGTSTGTSDIKRFDDKLQGTWVSDDPSVYNGTLVIGYDRITITGYGESQTPAVGGDDNKRPFKGFTKGVALKGYSEDGKLFIEDKGQLQEGVPYTYWETNSSPKQKFLEFNFGGRDETLQCQ